MRENEELFRTANERLRRHVEDAVADEQPIPFLCECVDDLCLARIEMTLDDFEHVRADKDTFAVASGHVAPAHEAVVENRPGFDVVRKDGI